MTSMVLVHRHGNKPPIYKVSEPEKNSTFARPNGIAGHTALRNAG